MKGAIIENNCTIGPNSIVTNVILDNCLAVGVPCRVVKEIYSMD